MVGLRTGHTDWSSTDSLLVGHGRTFVCTSVSPGLSGFVSLCLCDSGCVGRQDMCVDLLRIDVRTCVDAGGVLCVPPSGPLDPGHELSH